ncbi:hypothetical protein, partial [Sphingopyxis granuli]|uniref:hypothetical protein n=1 Tax=Sphingopyxis granuli TaxID=267128 RepID=UPI001C3F3114
GEPMPLPAAAQPATSAASAIVVVLRAIICLPLLSLSAACEPWPANHASLSLVMLNLFQHPWPDLSFTPLFSGGQAMDPETSSG